MYSGYDAPVLAGYDAEEDVLYAFVNHWVSEHKLANKIIALDPASGRFDDVARVGQAVFDSTGFDDFPEFDGGGGGLPIWEETDSFASVTGPAVQDYEGGRLFTLRNGRVVTVNVKSGRVEEGTALNDAMLLEYDESQVSLYLPTCCPNRVLRYDVETGETAVLGEVGTSTDAFSASTGISLYDPFNRRIWLNRNDSLLTVRLPDPPSAVAPSAAASSTGAFLAAHAPTHRKLLLA